MGTGQTLTEKIRTNLQQFLPSFLTKIATDQKNSQPENKEFDMSTQALRLQNRRTQRLVKKLKNNLDTEKDTIPEYKQSITKRIDRLLRKMRMNMDLIEAREEQD